MTTIRNFLFRCLIVCLCIIISGCNNVSSNSNHIDSSSNQEVVHKEPKDLLKGIVSEKEYEDVMQQIKDAQPEYDPFMSFCSYSDYRENSDQLSAVSFRGVPVLLTELANFETDSDSKEYEELFHYEYFLSGVVLSIWRLEIREASDISLAVEKKERYVNFLNYKDSEIPKILSSTESITNKINELRKFGIFVIPYITKEIENGKTEYEAFFTEIGLHLSVPEFMLIFEDYKLSNEEKYEKIRNADGAEDFDYKQWLSENQADLDAMFKFLDAYVKAE